MRVVGYHLLIGLTALGLAGCAEAPKSAGSRPATIQQIGNAQEFSDVVALLDQGDEKSARKRLDVMVKRDPNDVRSAGLLSTIAADPVKTLGSKAFDYHVETGDSFQGLAQRFLGDRLKFYLLARYNKIAVPASLTAGQTLRIPGTAPKPSPARPKTETVSAQTPITKPAAPKSAAPLAVAANPHRAAQLRAAGLAALNKGQVEQAVGLLYRALGAEPGNALIQHDLDRAKRIQATVKARK